MGFDVPPVSEGKKKYLLVGGGVGTAPMLLYGRQLLEAGHEPVFLLGGRSQRDLLELDRLRLLVVYLQPLRMQQWERKAL